MKRKLLILAVLCLLIAALAITVYADEILTYNVTGVPDAVIGETAYNGTVAVPAGVNYTGVEVQWYEANLNGEYWEFEEFSGKFANGKVYRRDTTVTGKFPWNEYFEVYISGMEADGHSCEDGIDENYYGKIVVEQYFYFTQEISSVEITGVTEPVLGQTATTSGIRVPTNAGYTVSAYWSTDDPEWAESDDPGEIVFKEGYYYSLNLSCTAKPGYSFPTGYTYSEEEDALQVTLNGEKCNDWHIDYWGSLTCTVWLDYDFRRPISSASISGALDIQPGQNTSDITVEVPENANYTVYISWRRYDFEIKQGVDFEGEFANGNVYGAFITLMPKEGYRFAEDVVVTWNGEATNTQDIPLSYADYVYIEKDIILGLKPIESVEMTASVQIGKKADPADIEIPANAPYYFEEVGWMEIDPKTGEYTTEELFTGTFKEGYFYVCGGYIRPKDGYCFTRNTVCTVNGTWDDRLNQMWASYGEVNINAVLGGLYDTPAYNGLVCVDGVWGYYEGGVLQTEYTGLVPYEDKIFYVEKGILTFTYTGLVYYMDEWRYVANSELTEGYTGLVYFNDNWFYTVNSRIDWTFTGMVEYEGNKFYVQNNLLDWSYTGLGYSDGEWYYFENALLKLDFTGLVNFDGTWFYVENGHLTFDYIGLAEYNGNRFYIQNNVLDWSYTGLGYHDGGWYYIENALLKADYNGLVYFNNTWFYIENGELTWANNGLVMHEGDLFYVVNSAVDWTYNGKATYEGTEYTVVNGFVDL